MPPSGWQRSRYTTTGSPRPPRPAPACSGFFSQKLPSTSGRKRDEKQMSARKDRPRRRSPSAPSHLRVPARRKEQPPRRPRPWRAAYAHSPVSRQAAGHSTGTVVPLPCVLVRSISPPWLRTMLSGDRQPEAGLLHARFCVVQNGSNTACKCSGAIPQPWSMISNAAAALPQRRGAFAWRAAKRDPHLRGPGASTRQVLSSRVHQHLSPAGPGVGGQSIGSAPSDRGVRAAGACASTFHCKQTHAPAPPRPRPATARHARWAGGARNRAAAGSSSDADRCAHDDRPQVLRAGTGRSVWRSIFCSARPRITGQRAADPVRDARPTARRRVMTFSARTSWFSGRRSSTILEQRSVTHAQRGLADGARCGCRTRASWWRPSGRPGSPVPSSTAPAGAHSSGSTRGSRPLCAGEGLSREGADLDGPRRSDRKRFARATQPSCETPEDAERAFSTIASRQFSRALASLCAAGALERRPCAAGAGSRHRHPPPRLPPRSPSR